jgi:hypothetical protein
MLEFDPECGDSRPRLSAEQSSAVLIAAFMKVS